MKLHMTPGARRQQGAVLIMTAAFIVAAVSLLALAVDTGRLYAAQVRLQSAANLAALDAARVVGACAASEPNNPQAAADSAVENAVTSNLGIDSKVSQKTSLGTREENNSIFKFRPSAPFAADSAKVTLAQPAPQSLLSVFSSSSSDLTATAAAISRPQATISAGSTLLDLGNGAIAGTNGLLSALLGGPVHLDLASYRGLANTNVTIGDLLGVQANVASLKELLNTELTLPGALSLLANAVDASVGGVNSVAGGALDTLAGIADPNRTVLLGDVLKIEPALENTIDSLPVNVADLLTGVAQAANTGSPISLPLKVDLGGLAKVDGTINIIQPRQIAAGRAGQDANGNYRTVASTAQANIQLNLEVLGALPDAIGGALIHLPIFIKAASAEARLNDIICAGQSKPFPPKNQHTVDIGTDTALATIGVGTFDNINRVDPDPSGEVTLVNAVGIAQVVTDGLAVNLTSAGCATVGSKDVRFDGPFPPQEGAEPQSKRVGVPLADVLNCGLNRLTNTLAKPGTVKIQLFGQCIPILCDIVSGVLAPVVGLVVGLVSPVLNILGHLLLEPLFQLLGLSVGPADISVNGVNINQPQLFCIGQDC